MDGTVSAEPDALSYLGGVCHAQDERSWEECLVSTAGPNPHVQ